MLADLEVGNYSLQNQYLYFCPVSGAILALSNGLMNRLMAFTAADGHLQFQKDHKCVASFLSLTKGQSGVGKEKRIGSGDK